MTRRIRLVGNLFLMALLGLTLASLQARAGSVCDMVAGNLVMDCGFEGTTTSSAQDALNTNWSANSAVILDATLSDANSGAYSAQFTQSADGSISQNLSTTVGDTYDVTVYFDAAQAGPVGWFDFTWGSNAIEIAGGTLGLGTSLSSACGNVSTSNTNYDVCTFSETAAAAQTNIEFTGNPDFGFSKNYYNLDDVSVVDTSSTTAVPEPGTLALLGSGLIGLVGFARRKFLKS